MERDPSRVVAFSDAVIAIAVTLLVLEIRPPQDTRHLFHGLATLWPSYLAYVVTFIIMRDQAILGTRRQPAVVLRLSYRLVPHDARRSRRS